MGSWRSAESVSTPASERTTERTPKQRSLRRASEWHVANRDRRYEDVKRRLAEDSEFRDYRRGIVSRKERERRAQKAGTDFVKISQQDYDKILQEYGNACWICGTELLKVFWDHYQPLARGGAHVVQNLRPSCNPCNVRKSATWPFTEDLRLRIADEVRALRTSRSTTGSVTDGEEVMADVTGDN